MIRLLIVIGLLALGHGVPIEQDAEQHDLDFVLRNMTALWEEVSNLRQEINHHLHEGHQEADHDKIKKEVETLHHEHHVHHLHHPHVGHNDHHSDELLMHLEEFHGHVDSHLDGQQVHSHTHGHGHSHDHHHGESGGDAEGDDSSEDGDDDSHEVHDDHHDDEHGHEHGHEEDHGSHHAEEDEHDTHGLHEHEDEHEYGHEHGHDHGEHAEHDHDHDHDHGHGHDHGHKHLGKADDPWHHALCTLKPNVDVPESQVSGSVVLSQRKDGKGPVYFDLHLKGIDVANTGRIHGFHVHANQVTEGRCGSTGGHFNPDEVTHGAPEDDVRHVGDLGNIEVNENGELHGYIIADDKVQFNGPNSILGKAIVVHAGVDDLGRGGDAGSLATGNAGGRLACCNIILQRSSDKDKVNFRFKG